jgi:NitT/TauT family transport system permease protein
MPRRFRAPNRRFPEVRARATKSLIYLVFSGVFVILAALVYQGGQQLTRLSGEDLSLTDLPWALGLSFFRMLASYVACLGFSMVMGILAARTRLGERILIPIFDVGQSVPILGFFPALISLFLGIASGHRIGVELAAIFLIFTCQFWNMGFAVYEVVKSLPDELLSAVRSFGVEGSLRFFRLYGPITIPRLVVNSILSWSNGWFFLVACEIIAFGPMRFHLPGIGSFLTQAAENGNLAYVFWGLGALTALILTMDFMIWRPLLAWSEKYHLEAPAPTPFSSRLRNKRGLRSGKKKVSEFRKQWRRVVRSLTYPITWAFFEIVVPLFWDLPYAMLRAGYRELSNRFVVPLTRLGQALASKSRVLAWIGISIPIACVSYVLLAIGSHLLSPPLAEGASSIPLAMLYSTGRVVLAMGLSIAWVLPVVLFVWDRPKLRSTLLTVSQVGASLPATALFPLFILLIVRKLGGGIL